MRNIKSFLWLCLLGLPASLTAQVGSPRTDFAIGFNAGCTLNRISFTPGIKQTIKPEFTGGITLRYTCEKYFKSLCAVQMEFNYANLGWQEVIETSSDTYSRDMHYLQVPILARMGWGYEKKGALFYVVAGPQLGFCLKDNENKTGAFSEETLNKRPNKVTQQYGKSIERPFDYGITAGLGVEVNTIKAGHFMLEGRYYFALSDIFNNGKKDPFSRSANGTIVAKLTYLFDVIKTKK